MSQACPYCGNLDFEEEDGLLVCTSCGRQQEGGLQVVDDDVEFGTQGKLNRMKIEKKRVKVTKIYRGARAYKLYLQAWQHIMWRQSYALIHGSAKAPPELWTVVRDLWTLKLSTLTDRLDSQVMPVSEGGDTDTDVERASSGAEPVQGDIQPKNNLTPKLWDTISYIYLAALLIRFPVSLSRIYELIRSEEIPFIRAIRFVPYEITSHLPSEYQLALDTISIPQRLELQESIYQFVRSFSLKFDMEIPALNWRILLYGWIVELGLPLEVYSTVKALSKILDYDFIYQLPSGKVSDYRKRTRRTPVAMPELQLISLIVVATKLLFPLPIASNSRKPCQDGNSCTSSSESRHGPLTDLSLNWPTWYNLHKSQTPSKPPAQKHIETTDRDVYGMSPKEMDEYMSWYQQTFATPDTILRQKKTDLEMSVLDMFPLPSTPPVTTASSASAPAPDTSDSSNTDARTELCKQIQSSALSYISTPVAARSSPSYPIFPSVEILESTDEFFKDNDDAENANGNPILFFHELAAKVACTDLKGLVKAVRYTEARMEKWIERRYREEMKGASGEEEVGVEGEQEE